MQRETLRGRRVIRRRQRLRGAGHERRGDGIDAAVAQLLLAAIEPAQLTIALEAIEHLEAQARAIDHQWQLRIERARYEAERARRRYEAVGPEFSLGMTIK